MSVPERLIDLYDRLTLRKTLLAIFAGFSVVVLIGFYEGRNTVFLTITGTPLAMLSFVVGMILLMVVGVAWLFVSALEKKTEQIVAELRDRVNLLQTQLAAERVECDKRIKEVRDMAQMALSRGIGRE